MEDEEKYNEEFIARFACALLETIANNITRAMGPVSSTEAPFYIKVFRDLTEEMEKTFPGAIELSKCFDDTEEDEDPEDTIETNKSYVS